MHHQMIQAIFHLSHYIFPSHLALSVLSDTRLAALL